MANILVERNSLSDIADSIRAKNGTQTTYKPSEMAAAIDALPSGGITPTGELEITANGTYNVTNYASAEVDVPQSGITPTGTISITQNGTVDVTQYANASVNVPTGGSTLGTKTIMENGTYNAASDSLDGYSSVTVNVSGGGGYTAADFADASKPEGAVIFDAVTFPADTAWFAGRTGVTKLFGTNYNETGNRTGTFRGMTGLQYAIFPKLTRAYNSFLYQCSNLEAVDWYGGGTGGSFIFASCTKLKTMVIRRTDKISALSSSNAFQGTLFDNGKAGGTLYVPSALISEYQAATNWSTYLGYANNQILPIEGSIYETQYVDGTPIPTA
jgi:hypothetical protein